MAHFPQPSVEVSDSRSTGLLRCRVRTFIRRRLLSPPSGPRLGGGPRSDAASGRSVRRYGAALALAGVFAVAGCAGGGPGDSSEGAGGASQSEEVELPGTPAGEASAEVLDLLNGEAEIVPGDFDGRLAPIFREELPEEELAELLNQQFRPAQPFTATDYQGDENLASTRLETPHADTVDMTVSIDEDGLIDGLHFVPAG
jgi:hypothetical protein